MFRVQGLEFGVKGLGLGVYGSGLAWGFKSTNATYIGPKAYKH